MPWMAFPEQMALPIPVQVLQRFSPFVEAISLVGCEL